MAPDGKAGQWVVEFVSDKTEPVSEDGRTGTAYQVRRVRVASAADEKVSELPDMQVTLPTPQKFQELSAACLSGLNVARSTLKGKRFDLLDVMSHMQSTGPCTWWFRLYDRKAKKFVRRVGLSGDGKKVLEDKEIKPGE